MRMMHGNAKMTANMDIDIKLWDDGVEIEEAALKQIKNVSMMPFVFKYIAVMPDAHFGRGSTIGTVIATKGAIIPAAVGVDIGCGMIAVKTPLVASDLPDNLFDLRSSIEAAIPHGRTNNGGQGDKGSWNTCPSDICSSASWLSQDYCKIIEKHPLIKPKKEPWNQLGTLGSGNHFIEICLDQNQCVWIMLHSGSRGIGNKIGSYFIEKAKEEMHRYYIQKFIPDIDLAYLVEETELFDDYIFAMTWAQAFAFQNRQLMMEKIIYLLAKKFPAHERKDYFLEKAINCHHNYVAFENHFNENVFITRKGALRAREGDLGIIPGSMGAKSFIVRGKGNADSFHSCSHGAGRAMSRNEAKKKFTLDDHIKATQGIECRKDLHVIDETPGAYKDIDAVMAAQSDLIEIIYTLKQIICVKG
jgi:tRNA-splicing ligase RtcB (3'-phosphate/5'-hydroxy nucleic acid ligase)